MTTMNTEEQYRQEWSTKTGRPASDVYVPEALRTSIAVGDKVRILVDGLEGSETRVGDVLTVVENESAGFFYTDTPRLLNVPSRWIFPVSGEGVDWERVR